MYLIGNEMYKNIQCMINMDKLLGLVRLGIKKVEQQLNEDLLN